jgi:hypothetical protein
MQELYTREILPAWRAAREFVGGPEVAGAVFPADIRSNPFESMES